MTQKQEEYKMLARIQKVSQRVLGNKSSQTTMVNTDLKQIIHPSTCKASQQANKPVSKFSRLYQRLKIQRDLKQQIEKSRKFKSSNRNKKYDWNYEKYIVEQNMNIPDDLKLATKRLNNKIVRYLTFN